MECTASIPQSAFVDAYGDHSLSVEKAGVTTYFIVSGVLVDSPKVQALRDQVEQVRRKHFGSAEMKSKSIGGDDARRLRVLGDLANLPFHAYTVAVDKREIDPNSGLIYKQPFLKFLHGMLFKKLFRTYPNLQLVCDEHGSKEFMEGFVKYVRREQMSELFGRATFRFASSREEPLLQLSDMMAGTFARLYDPKKQTEFGKEFLTLLADRIIGFDDWPPTRVTGDTESTIGTQHDRRIREYCLSQAALYLRENAESVDRDVMARVETLKRLLFHFRFIDAEGYLSGPELVEHLREQGYDDANTYYLKSAVIAKLRDADVIVSSSSRGYKIPASVGDVLSYVRLTNAMLLPMRDRLRKARAQILLLTKNGLDIMQDTAFEELRKIVD